MAVKGRCLMGQRARCMTSAKGTAEAIMVEAERVLRQAGASAPPRHQDAGIATDRDTTRLVIAEEQQILRQAFQSYFVAQPDIDVVGSSGDTAGDSLARMASALSPDVMVLGFRALEVDTVEKLEMVRESNPDVSLVVLSAYYDVKGLKALRELFRRSDAGCAYLLKHTIDTVEQLAQVAHLVSEGRVILDSLVMEGLLESAEPQAAVLEVLTPREMEVLSWMAKGYRNTTIAGVLCLEPEIVGRHISSIYGKLGEAPESRDERVHAIMLYLKATGQLPAEDLYAGW